MLGKLWKSTKESGLLESIALMNAKKKYTKVESSNVFMAKLLPPAGGPSNAWIAPARW